MKKEIKYSIAEVQNARWLADLTWAVQLLSQSYFEWLLKNTENNDKTDFSNYLIVTRKLCEVLEIWKSMSTDHIMRESTFNVTFETEKSEKNSDTLTNSGRKDKQQDSKKWKRVHDDFQSEMSCKKSASSCSACDLKDHDLPDYWIVFEEKRLKNVRKFSAYQVHKIKETLANDNELATQVEEIQRVMKQKSE